MLEILLAYHLPVLDLDQGPRELCVQALCV
jgi:hypothetical protein